MSFRGPASLGRGDPNPLAVKLDVEFRSPGGRPGAPQVAKVLRRVLDENHWWTLSPQPALIQGDPGDGQSRIVALRSNQGNRILVYLPANRGVRVKLDVIGGSKATARWFDPRDGRETPALAYPAGSTLDCHPPLGWEDAVLLVESASTH